MALSDTWVEELSDVTLSYLYRICNRLIEADDSPGTTRALRSKGEEDVAWAVKYEFEHRPRAEGSNPGVWLTKETR